MTETETKPGTPTRETPQPGWDAFLEDVFGLNFRAILTVKDMFMRPAAVFRAARDINWAGKYTPSMRLVFSLLAVMLLLRFFWAGENSPIYEQIDTALREGVVDNPDTDVETLTDRVLNSYFLIFPFAFALIQTVIAALVRIWGRGTKLVTRIRSFYLVMVPGMIWAIFSSTLMGLDFVATLTWLFVVDALIGLSLDWATCWRCLAGVHAGAARVWRASLYAFASQGGAMFASVLAILVAGMIVIS